MQLLKVLLRKTAFLGLLAIALGAPAPSAWPASCLTRVDETMIQAYGDLPTIYLQTPHLRNVIEIPLDQQEKLGIKRITKLKELGKGGMGIVYLVSVETTRGETQTMAWKEVKHKAAQKEKDGMKLQHLASRATFGPESGSHAQHVVPVVARFLTAEGEHPRIDDGFYEGYLMDRAGPSMSSFVAPGGELSLDEDFLGGEIKTGTALTRALRGIVALARGISASLAELSRAGIVHKDLKPGNIVIMGGENNTIAEFLSGRATVGVIDFGLSSSVGWEGMKASGTPGYLAPERWGRDPLPESIASDVYSFATIIHDCLTGLGPPPYVKGQPLHPPLTPEEALGNLALRREQLVEAGASALDLRLFDELRRLTLQGLIPSPQKRMQRFRDRPSPFLRITEDGKGITGPDPIPTPAH